MSYNFKLRAIVIFFIEKSHVFFRDIAVKKLFDFL